MYYADKTTISRELGKTFHEGRLYTNKEVEGLDKDIVNNNFTKHKSNGSGEETDNKGSKEADK